MNINQLSIRNRYITFPVISGILLFLSFPSFNFSWMAWFAFIPLFYVLDQSLSSREAFKKGFLTGFTFYLGLINWVVNSMTNYGGLSIYVSVLGLILMVSFLSVFFGIFTYALHHFSKYSNIIKWGSAPFIWVSLELFRTDIFPLFPWGVIGYSQHDFLPLIQIADITGVYGTSFIIILVNICVYLNTIYYLRAISDSERLTKRYINTLTITTSLILFIFTAYGYMRINKVREQDSDIIKVGLVQGNIDQGIKWDPAFKNSTLNIYKDLTYSILSATPNLIVWPEAATPFYFQRRDTYRRKMLGIARTSKTHILFGSPAYEITSSKTKNSFNRAYLLTPEGNVSGFYDKMILVPYGEYVPFKKYFPFLDKLVQEVGDFVSGKEFKVFETPKGSFSTLICYEVIFPNLVRHFVKEGAQFLVNITNDAWFGNSSAPYQHMGMVPFRAIENRVPIVRSANTGITGIINAFGEVTETTRIFETAAIVNEIKLTKRNTSLYTQYGDIFGYLCMFFSVVVVILSIINKGSKK